VGAAKDAKNAKAKMLFSRFAAKEHTDRKEANDGGLSLCVLCVLLRQFCQPRLIKRTT
jgi:hypothetical protein